MNLVIKTNKAIVRLSLAVINEIPISLGLILFDNWIV